MKKILILIFALTAMHETYSYELEVQIGRSLIEARLEAYEKSLNELKKTSTNEKLSFLIELEKSFKESDGYSFMKYVSFVKIGWNKKREHEWVAEISGKFSQKELEKTLKKTSWQKEKKYWANKGIYLFFKKKKIIVTKTKRAKEIISNLDFKIGVAHTEGLDISLDEAFMKNWASKAQKVQLYLQMIKGMEFKLEQKHGSLSLDFYDPSQAVFATGMISTAIEFLKGMIEQVKEKPGASDSLLDWMSYSQSQVFAFKVLEHLKKLEPKSFGAVLSLNYSFESSLKEIYQGTIGQISSAVISLIVALNKKGFDWNQIHSLNMGEIPSLGMANGTKMCEKEIEMIEQSLDFYNNDHIKSGTWEEVKTKLFSEGYLPEDIVCKGEIVKNNDLFKTNSFGKLELK
ncbi:MAG: hypothetical protein COB02_05670 [Candidatus Cloacimonadota bacterium]|nr:MAG: hypothetical protein COB02_05670 [Candidatus Cloacimonadota bacterium]